MIILLINPNTTQLITERAVDAARSVASSGTVIDGVTGHFGAPIINSLTDNAIGAYCAIELAAKHANDYDGIVLAVSFDTALFELREMLSIPVAGMSESAMQEASRLGGRFSLISFGQRTKLLYEKLAIRYGKARQLASVRCLDALTPSQMSDTDFLAELVSEELAVAVKEDGAEVGILSATAFTGLADKLNCNIPVVDGVTTAVRAIESAVQGASGELIDLQFPEKKQLEGVSIELANWYSKLPN